MARIGPTRDVGTPPVWLMSLPDDAGLTADEVASIFNYNSTNTVRSAMRDGRLPPPQARVGKQKSLRWSAKSIREEFARRTRALKEVGHG